MTAALGTPFGVRWRLLGHSKANAHRLPQLTVTALGRAFPVYLSVEEAGELVGLGRSKAYDEARRHADHGQGGLPAVRFGRTLVCPTVAVLRPMGLEPDAEPNPALIARAVDETEGVA